MKKLLFFILSLTFLFAACSKENEVSTLGTIEVGTNEKLLSSGSFTGTSRYSTSGNVKLVEGADKKKYLIFDNLKSDNGPDLRVYLSEDNSAKVFTEVANKVTVGNSKIEVPAAINTDKQKTVLIWCKQFSVLFGSAELK
jgi:uncharacterized protein YukJ